jgi:hypothetical protein
MKAIYILLVLVLFSCKKKETTPPPPAPTTPAGPTLVEKLVQYSYSSCVTDAEFNVDWNGDNTTDTVLTGVSGHVDKATKSRYVAFTLLGDCNSGTHVMISCEGKVYEFNNTNTQKIDLYQ